MREEPMEEIVPWYRGFEGTTVSENSSRFRLTGTLKKVDSTTIEITELPIKSWTQNYKETLESWVVGTDKSPAWIKDYKEYHTDSKVHFVIHLDEANMKKAEKEGLEAKFKVSTTVTTSNIVAHDLHGRIKKYNTINEIIKDFYDIRLGFYYKRKVCLQLTY
jgi:DNA topoisomerase-2